MLPFDPTTASGGVRLVGVRKAFGDVVALEKVDLEIESASLLVLLGPSGCGKTTTLNILAGLDTPTSGEVYFGEQSVLGVPPEQRNISMVFQTTGLYPHLNVKQNIVFPLRLKKVPKSVVEERVQEISILLEISDLMKRKLHELSGGERQRVAIAKALVKRPRLFLLDEPFSSLDAELRRRFRAELVEIHQQLATTMVFVTHDQEEAMSVASQIALMRDGRVVQKGAPTDLYTKPKDLWTAQFIGTHPINTLNCFLGDSEGFGYLFGTDGPRVAMDKELWRKARGKARSEEVVLGIRPEFVRVGTQKSHETELQATVHTAQVLGRDTLHEFKVDAQYTLRAIVPSMEMHTVGEPVYLGFDWAGCLVFDKGTGTSILS